MNISVDPAQPAVEENYEITFSDLPRDVPLSIRITNPDGTFGEGAIEQDESGTFKMMEAQGDAGTFVYSLRDGSGTELERLAVEVQ